jgi:hypothetical protein
MFSKFPNLSNPRQTKPGPHGSIGGMRSLEFLQERERFLPVQEATLLEWMLEDPRLSAEERADFRLWFEMVRARFHHEFRREATELAALYDTFDPDRDTIPLAELDPAELPARRARLGEAFARLLAAGNYQELPLRKIIDCVELQTSTGVRVQADLREYDEVRAFYRGVSAHVRVGREQFRPWRQVTQRVHTFARAALLIRLKRDPDHVLLKLFKTVVAEDLEMILPQVRICMRWFDVLKIGSSAAGSVATAGWKAFTAAILSPWIFLLVLLGFSGAAVKGVFSFFASRTKYMQRLASKLYFQNLANNRSALALLIESAEAEEVKETLLAYYILYVERDKDYTVDELDRRVEAWLREHFSSEVDFEVHDAVRKLVAKGLMLERPAADGRRVLKVYDLPSSIRRLDEAWDGFYRAPRPLSEDRLAEGRTLLPRPSAEPSFKPGA